MKLDVADAPSKVIERLQNGGYHAFIVGGSVRDLMMGDTPKDWDITTSATPDKVMRLFEKTIPTGLAHGTVTVILDDTPIEVTTYRVESEYEENRRPKSVEFVHDIKQDLARRDFTINAMAYNERAGLIDLFGGVEDIQNKLIKCVGVPSERYQEDALRMLRAVRFAARLGFDIQQDTLDAIKLHAHLLKNISMQRIKNEFALGLNSRFANKMLIMWQTGMDRFIHPSLNELASKETFEMVRKMPEILPVRMALLFEKIEPEQIRKILREMEFDNHTIKLTINILQALKISEMTALKRFISKNGFEAIEDACYILKEKYGEIHSFVRNFKVIKDTMPPIQMSQLKINGEDLKNIGICDGITIGKILNEILEKVWETPNINEKSILIEYVKKTL